MMSKVNKNNPQEMARLSWACRRGMLELDILLTQFLNAVYPQLSAQDQQIFKLFLELPDPQLFAYIMGHETPGDPDIALMAKKVRQHARFK